MNIFSNTWGVYILALLPLLLLMLPFRVAARKKRREKWGGDLMDSYSFASRRRFRLLKLACTAGALSCVFFAFARPQWGEVERRAAVSDLDMIILFDVSRSMNVADISPSRLERGKMEVKSLIERTEGCRIGLVAFSSLPLILSPLTAFRDSRPQTDTGPRNRPRERCRGGSQALPL